MSKIEWTNRTWNPVTGCDKISQGCKHCYAEVMHNRLMGMFPGKYSKPFLGNVQMHSQDIDKPLHWKKPAMVFVNSMSDLFHHSIPFEFIDSCFDVMDAASWHTFQVLTKRAERMYDYFKWKESGHGLKFDKWPLPNVWMGISAEDQEQYDKRVHFLVKIPAAIRFLSCEPLLGPINLRLWSACTNYNHRYFGCCGKCIPDHEIHWVIVGGESGNKSTVRPMSPYWIRSLRNQCKESYVPECNLNSERKGIPFFFKQWGTYIPYSQITDPDNQLPTGDPTIIPSNYQTFYKVGKSKSGNTLDGKQHLEFPTCGIPVQVTGLKPYTATT